MVATAATINQATASHRLERRYWQRRDKPGGWWPWGLLPLLGLLLAFLFGLFITAPAIEDRTAGRVREALADNGVADVTVDADGQHVLVSGVGSDADAERIRNVARDATCDTWLAKTLVCPTRVEVRMRAPEHMAPVQVASAPAPQVVSPPVVAARLHDFRFSKSDGAIALRGEVPSAALRDQIVAGARSLFDEVTDELRITDERASAGYGWAVDRVWPALAAMDSGEVAWTAGRLSVIGSVAAADETGIRQGFGGSEHPERLGAIQLDIIKDAGRCNEEFAATFAASSIRFRTGSAEISPDSANLLAELAMLAQSCPNRLVVEGHTDNIGAEGMNRSLSRARAEAVVTALVGLGVEASRLAPRGYGPSRPIADNATSAGRAQNRRIEIKAIDPGAEQI